MTIDQIRDEYDRNGRLSGRAMNALRQLLRESNDPYSAITLAGDAAAFQLADTIALHLSSSDVMVRWNAVGVLFTRFRDVRFVGECLDLLEKESDSMVRSIALCGAGELLALVEDAQIQQPLARKLIEVFSSERELPEVRSAAYEGIEAALGVPPLDRAPADRVLNLQEDVSPERIDAFRKHYGV